MITVVPFEVNHAVELMKGSITENTLEQSEDIAKQYGELYASRGPSFSAFDETGKILGCAGIMILWEGTGEAWILFSDDSAKEYRKEAYTIITDYLIQIIKDKSLKRVQSHCDVRMPHAVKYLENLGFQREGVLRKFKNGNDHYMYSMVFD